MKVLENTPAVLSLGKLCDENGYSYEWINGQKPHLIKDGIRIICNTENFVPVVVPGLSSSSSGSLSTLRTSMKQESHSSSSSPSSPTVDEIPVREREDAPDSDISLNVISAHSNFSEDIQIERMVDRSGQPDERNSSNAQIRTLLEEQRQTIIAEYCEKVSHHELQAARAEENAEFYEKNYGDSNWNFVKLVNKVLQKWKNYGNSRVLPSIRSQEGSSSRTRTLFWNYQAEYRKNCKMK